MSPRLIMLVAVPAAFSFAAVGQDLKSRSLSVRYDDGCLLRYADAPFFGTADTRDWMFVWAVAYVNVTDAARMNETRWRLLSDLAERAGDDGALRLMSGGTRYTDARGEEQVLYGFVHYTRDLEASECTRCLVLALTLLSERKDLNSSLAGSVN
ncbi:unnamed protein product [Miscanthus lutarioriparius]|uniref:Gnk2-homologous domain-containing protein n=1 Tax=Miscanthus lutarioriparius TaxID=422564 RepID=A0A811M5T1_9POAL|nr:unnamed protein product [Miscanthus lutarioriparius]